MFKTRILGAVAVGTMIIAGCSASTTDFKAAAEKAIAGIGEGIKGTCEKPTSTKVGSTFNCTATKADGTVVPLLATITDSHTVTVGTAPDTATPTGSTPAAGSTPTADTSGGATPGTTATADTTATS